MNTYNSCVEIKIYRYNQTVTVLTDTRIWIPEVLARILKVQRLTLLTLAADSVVQTANTDTTAYITRCSKYSGIKPAFLGMAITVTPCDGN